MLKVFENFVSQFSERKWAYFVKIFLTVVICLDYKFNDNIDHILGNWFYVIPISALILTSLPLFHRWKHLHTHGVLLLVYHLLVGIFLISLTSVYGPYFQILILVLFASIYWYGWRGLWVSLLAEALIISLATSNQFSIVSAQVIYVGLIHFSVLLAVGVLFATVYENGKSKADQSQLKETISFERTRLVSLINSMADAVIATDSKGIIALYNGAALDLLNTNSSLENKPIVHFLSLYDEQGRHIDIVRLSAKENRMIKRNDLHFISNENQQVDVSLSISPVRSAFSKNDEEGFILVMQDITKQKSLDEEKNEFISVTSHELRTPIAIAEANISTALHPNVAGDLKPEIKELLEQAHHNIIFLGDLVNDLTTLARAERGDLEINIKLLDPQVLLRQLEHDYREECKEKGLTIKAVSPKKVQSILTSELYIREVLQNFITNSIKYTNTGGITLSAETSEHGGVKFCVADTGIGISNSDKKNIFSKFYRSEDFRTRKTRGTGLGLYITLKLAERVHGKIWFDSTLNKGSKFYLQVPPIGALKKDHPQVAKEEIKDFAQAV